MNFLRNIFSGASATSASGSSSAASNDSAGGSCSWCGEAKDSLKRCGRCHSVAYCSTDCQRAHWRSGHRTECGENEIAIPTPSSSSASSPPVIMDSNMQSMAQAALLASANMDPEARQQLQLMIESGQWQNMMGAARVTYGQCEHEKAEEEEFYRNQAAAHGHSHGGGGHDHGHSHGDGGDHGHSHGDHDHSHSHGDGGDGTGDEHGHSHNHNHGHDHGHSHGDHSHGHDHGHSHGDDSVAITDGSEGQNRLALEGAESDNAHSHSHGDHHGHSHGAHSHGDDNGDHGHSHGDHGHSHGDHDHGHSHGDHDHDHDRGHSHAGHDHGHSHGDGDDHGHSHGDHHGHSHAHDENITNEEGALKPVDGEATEGTKAIEGVANGGHSHSHDHHHNHNHHGHSHGQHHGHSHGDASSSTTTTSDGSNDSIEKTESPSTEGAAHSHNHNHHHNHRHHNHHHNHNHNHHHSTNGNATAENNDLPSLERSDEGVPSAKEPSKDDGANQKNAGHSHSHGGHGHGHGGHGHGHNHGGRHGHGNHGHGGHGHRHGPNCRHRHGNNNNSSSSSSSVALTPRAKWLREKTQAVADNTKKSSDDAEKEKPKPYALPIIAPVDSDESISMTSALANAGCNIGGASVATDIDSVRRGHVIHRINYSATATRRPLASELPTSVVLLPLDNRSTFDPDGVENERRTRTCPLCALSDAPANTTEEALFKQQLKESHVSLAQKLSSAFAFRNARLANNRFNSHVPHADCVVELHIIRRKMKLRLPDITVVRNHSTLQKLFPLSKAAKKAAAKRKKNKEKKAENNNNNNKIVDEKDNDDDGDEEDNVNNGVADEQPSSSSTSSSSSSSLVEKELLQDVYILQLVVRLVPSSASASTHAANALGTQSGETLTRFEFVAPLSRLRGPALLVQVALDFVLGLLQTPVRNPNANPDENTEKSNAVTVAATTAAAAATTVASPLFTSSSTNEVRIPSRIAIWTDRCEFCGVVGVCEEEEARPASSPVTPATPSSANTSISTSTATASASSTTTATNNNKDNKDTATIGDVMTSTAKEHEQGMRVFGGVYMTYKLADLRLNIFPYGHSSQLYSSWKTDTLTVDEKSRAVKQHSTVNVNGTQINIVVDEQTEKENQDDTSLSSTSTSSSSLWKDNHRHDVTRFLLL